MSRLPIMLPVPSRIRSENSNALPGENICIVSSITAIKTQKRMAVINLFDIEVLNIAE